jgi:hypothetical protein
MDLFIPKKPSTPVKNITPRKSGVKRLDGVYTPQQISNPSKRLSESISSLQGPQNARIEAKFASGELQTTIAAVVEGLMWHDQPTLKTFVRRAFIRSRVAEELGLEVDWFKVGGWKRNSRAIIDDEMVINPHPLLQS